MKKIITILLILAFCGGIGFLGYTIFFSKNIEKVEYEGGVQTLYLVDETSTPKFHDAKLKITYKGGSIKYISMTEAYNKGSITVTDFSTSIEAQRTMKINYKSNIVDIKYDVIASGMYYVNSYKKIVSNSELAKTNYSLQTTTEMFELLSTGEFKYYVKKSGTEWYLYDGRNISSYRYEIVANTLKIYLGEEEPAYNVTVEKDTRGFVISAVKSQFNNEGMETSRVIKGLTYTDKKTNAVIDKEKANFIYQNNSFSGEYFKFYLNETFADRQGDVLLNITYKTPIVSYSTESTTVAIIQTLLVIADDTMVKSGNALETVNRWDYNKTVSLWYEGIEFELTYQVKVKS